MINQLLLICTSIIIYEFVRFVNLIKIIKSNLKIYNKIIKLFRYKKVSDSRKEKLIFSYSKLLFIISLKIFSIIVIILIFVLTLNLLSNLFLDLIISKFGILQLTIIFIIYHQLRKKNNAKL